MLQIKDFQFFKDADAIGDSIIVQNDMENLTLSAVPSEGGTFAFTVSGRLNNTWHTLQSIKLSDFTFVSSIVAAGAYSVAAIEGFDAIKLTITAITGTLTVDARFSY